MNMDLADKKLQSTDFSGQPRFSFNVESVTCVFSWHFSEPFVIAGHLNEKPQIIFTHLVTLSLMKRAFFLPQPTSDKRQCQKYCITNRRDAQKQLYVTSSEPPCTSRKTSWARPPNRWNRRTQRVSSCCVFWRPHGSDTTGHKENAAALRRGNFLL